MERVSEVAVGFGRALGQSGLDAPASSVICFAQALAVLGLGDPAGVYWAGHASFVRSPDEAASYGSSFAAFFGDEGPQCDDPPAQDRLAMCEDEEGRSDQVGSDGVAGEPGAASYSPSEILRKKDLATCTRVELAQIYRLMDSLRRLTAPRRSRRMASTNRRRGPLDLRRSVRRSLRAQGELTTLWRRGPDTKERPVVLLVDVSGSMEPYARAFLHFAHAAVVCRRRVEAFTVGTRLTRITRELSSREGDAALARAVRSIPDLSGGTRLGEGLGAFNDRFGIAGMARGAIVTIFSDGWDRGDPAAIAGEMARLRRVAHRIIWVNPLKATPGYAPVARGMAAAIPFVDEFTEGHSLEALERLLEVMAL
jgi:uncharacterized protein with von Willebrand factor type A (vWA) domain